MARVQLSALAKQDVRDILTDLSERAGPAVARRYGADFKRIYRSLSQFPAGGSPRRSLGSEVRIKIVYPYVAFYESAADSVTILRVLHGHRDITAKLLARSRGVAPPPRG
jgi:plasmid stabilization system protein ParE